MTSQDTFEIKNVIWALDVFTDIPWVEEVAAQNIANFLRTMKGNPKIFPINVFPGIHEEEHLPYVESEIEKRLEKFKIPNREPVKVIPENMIYPTSINDKVLTLIDYAKEIQCDLIVATTHAQQTASHMIIGSFTNELLAESPISLLILNPSCEVKTEFNRVLLPLESYNSETGNFKLAGNIVKQLNGSLDVFYHIQDQASKYFSEEGWMWKILKTQQQRSEKRVELSRMELRKTLLNEVSNFEITCFVDTLSFKESITSYIKANNVSLVLLGGMGSRIPSKLPLSVIEYTIRSAGCPVLIVR